MTLPPRSRPPAGFGAARGLALLLLVSATPAAARAWHHSYASAQQQLVEGRAAEAETSLLSAISDRSQAGCRLRTYGMKVRDYTPWYYLGVALADQGREDEAVEAFTRSLAEGVVQSCPGTQLQALDLLDRLERRGGSPDAPPAVPSQLDDLRQAALDAGAEQLAAEEVERARAAEAGCGDCPRAAGAWLEALSRARVDGPILAMLEQSAREALLAAELATRRAGTEGEPFRAQLDRVASLLAKARAPGAWLEAEAAAESVLADLPAHATMSGVLLPPIMSPGSMTTLEAIQRAERVAPRDGAGAPADVAQAFADLARARELTRLGGTNEWELALVLAERARAVFVRENDARVERSLEGVRRALIELSWSGRARVARRAVLPVGEEP